MGLLRNYNEYIEYNFKNGDSDFLAVIYYVALVIGTIKGAYIVIGVLSFLNQHILRRRPNLYQRYADQKLAKRSWVVVTGASDGIGAEFCRQLAKEGFNIALVSRTLEKIIKVEGECKKINPQIETRIVQADFAGNTNLSYYQNIYQQLQDLDIAILVNNAGVARLGRLD